MKKGRSRDPSFIRAAVQSHHGGMLGGLASLNLGRLLSAAGDQVHDLP